MNAPTNSQTTPADLTDNLTATVSALVADQADLRARLACSEARTERAEAQGRRFRVAGGVLVTAITLAVVAPVVSPAIAQGYGVTLASLNTRLTAAEGKITALQTSDTSQQSAITTAQADIAALQTKTASMSVLTDPATNQPTVRFTNTNVQVVSGSGTTEGTINGRGNLIIGYNETRGGDVRTGSHNLIAGIFNNYSGKGGVVFGYANSISSVEATVTGGGGNMATSNQASVSGGGGNMATSNQASVSGGSDNTASGVYSSVSGGQRHVASGPSSSVSGGQGNVANGGAASVSGGNARTAPNNLNWVAGTQAVQ